MSKEKHVSGIQESVENILGTNTTLKLKKKTTTDEQFEVFSKIITMLEECEVRSLILGNDLGMDFTQYDEKYYLIIDSLINLHFGKEISELIFFYLYERISPDGSVNELMDEDNKVVEFKSPVDLWNVIKEIQVQQSKIGKAKRK